MRLWLWWLMLAGVGWGQPSGGATLSIPMQAGPLTVQSVGQTQHSFQPLGLGVTHRDHVPLTLTSAMTFLVQNPGATSGWSLVLSETHSVHSLGLDYLPGSGTVVRTAGTVKAGDLVRDQTGSGTSLREGRKVLSAPAGTNYGAFQYTLASGNWELPVLPAGTLPGTYSWTITATVQGSP